PLDEAACAELMPLGAASSLDARQDGAYRFVTMVRTLRIMVVVGAVFLALAAPALAAGIRKEMREVHVFSAGECFQVPAGGGGSSPVSCDQPHEREDYATFTHAGPVLAERFQLVARRGCKLLLNKFG